MAVGVLTEAVAVVLPPLLTLALTLSLTQTLTQASPLGVGGRGALAAALLCVEAPVEAAAVAVASAIWKRYVSVMPDASFAGTRGAWCSQHCGRGFGIMVGVVVGFMAMVCSQHCG